MSTVQEMFPLGAKVLQRFSGSCVTGSVCGHESGGRVLVRWADFPTRESKHLASFLELVPAFYRPVSRPMPGGAK